MADSFHCQPGLIPAAKRYWREQASLRGRSSATASLIAAIWEFLRDSTPSRLRQRFGDADYDWDHRVNTTSGALGWRERLLGNFYSAYQPTDAPSFHEMIDVLCRQTNLNLPDFTFMDLGSGKGRTLLMASNYPFRRVVGIELLPGLNQIACENIRKYTSESQRCFDLESICADATRFPIPEDPLVIFLFNPFPEVPLREVLSNIENALALRWRPMYVLYYNPQLERLLAGSACFRQVYRAEQYSIFAAVH